MNIGLWWRTVRDIPSKQLMARVEFEIKQRCLPKTPLPLRRRLALGSLPTTPPLRKNYLKTLEITATESSKILEENLNPPPTSVPFTFLNKTRTLLFPIPWNSKEYSRLWQFNLHYFEWIRNILTNTYEQKKINQEAYSKFYYLITNWINNNPLYSFDGWHPYTTSLRIVNWTYAIRAIPSLATPEILNSLWQQVNYLHRNKESFVGGNHLLENLRALIIGGLNFDHPKANKIVQIAIKQLEQQLSHQILQDGGHYERSPMYHLVVMNLVGESIACLHSSSFSYPDSILNSLTKMLEFAQGIRLANGNFPLWNDAAYKITYSLDETIIWITQLLKLFDLSVSSQFSFQNKLPNLLHQQLITDENCASQYSSPKPETSSSTLLYSELPFSSYHAPITGYSVLRNAQKIELAFDYAVPCPNELPGHAHADCLAIDLYYQGQPIIVDTGTSEYTGVGIREYERSTKAHNTIEIASRNQSEVWGSFRVGQKAKPFNIKSGIKQNLHWVSASHDGYKNTTLMSNHHRWIGLYNKSIIILDTLDSQGVVKCISRFHFAPNLEIHYNGNQDTYFCPLFSNNTLFIKVLGQKNIEDIVWKSPKKSKSWYSPEFGTRISRGCLEIQSQLNQSQNIIATILTFGFSPQVNFTNTKSRCILEIDNVQIQWKVNKIETELENLITIV